MCRHMLPMPKDVQLHSDDGIQAFDPGSLTRTLATVRGCATVHGYIIHVAKEPRLNARIHGLHPSLTGSRARNFTETMSLIQAILICRAAPPPGQWQQHPRRNCDLVALPMGHRRQLPPPCQLPAQPQPPAPASARVPAPASVPVPTQRYPPASAPVPAPASVPVPLTQQLPGSCCCGVTQPAGWGWSPHRRRLPWASQTAQRVTMGTLQPRPWS